MVEILEFPDFKISDQLFYVGGAARSGGLTTGGASILSPEPGGFSNLEITPSLVTTEWESPLMSWLMSNVDGAVFRIRLAPTPQILTGSDPWLRTARQDGIPWDTETPWDGGTLWDKNVAGLYVEESLKSSNVVTFTVPDDIDRRIERGIVIGHKNRSYLIHSYERVSVTTIRAVVKPPLRDNIAFDDVVYFRPYFLGTISNGGEVRKSYERALAGNIEPSRIMFSEAVI